MTLHNSDQGINTHYGQKDLASTLLDALKAAGKNPEHLRPEDLEPLDQLHTRGKEATLELLRLASFVPGARILDVGGGIGGTARMLAASQGAQVTVIDLTEEYCRVGEMLTRHSGLEQLVHFTHGNALEMPFADASFDAVITQHSTMNIPDKPRLFQEMRRVLKPGGHYAFYEIMAGVQPSPQYPLPWASSPAISFLDTPETTRALLLKTGFREIHWIDTTPSDLTWFHKRISVPRDTPAPILGLHLLIGPQFPVMFRNVLTNLEQQRLRIMQGVFERV